jgi:hypothetical protein
VKVSFRFSRDWNCASCTPCEVLHYLTTDLSAYHEGGDDVYPRRSINSAVDADGQLWVCTQPDACDRQLCLPALGFNKSQVIT